MWPGIRRLDAPGTALHRRYAPTQGAADSAVSLRAPAAPRSTPAASPRRGLLYEGEPEACRRDPRHFLPVLAHFALLWAVFRYYRVEGPAFRSLMLIALAALPVHYLTPFRWKKPLFVAVSAAGLGWVFGPATTAVVLALSAVLVGVCYAPTRWAVRAGTVAALAVTFGLMRAGLLAPRAGVPVNVWPVLASMFMFRMIIFLYELKHAKRPESPVDALSYFFLLPNYCFLHFPVVDYRTLQRGFFADEVHATQRAGLRMMFRGTAHLLLYRLVYHELLITPDDVRGPLDLAAYLACNYLLYLRVSGQFHVACGVLHLFGYQLPETHRHYLIATGFTDYWRRINIYWKDFMVRVVFNPVVFRLKWWPQPAALAAATAVVFAATWGLHAYQSFWLRGTWGLSWPDALFWGVLGLLVMVNVQLDARRNPAARRAAGGCQPGGRGLAVRALKTAGTLATITVLWSLWSSPSVGAWADMMRRGATGGWHSPAWPGAARASADADGREAP
jgi:hypothetical protein